MMGFDLKLSSRRMLRATLLLALSVIGILARCSLEKPQAPKWDLPILIPLFDKTFTVQSLSEQSDNLFIGYQGLLGIQYSGQLDTTRIGNQLTLENLSRSFCIQVGQNEIASGGRVSQCFGVDQIWPGLLSGEEQWMVISAMPQSGITGSGNEESDFLSMSIQKGAAQLSVENEFPVQMAPFKVRILATKTATPILSFDFPGGIGSGQTRQQVQTIANLSIPQEMSWEITTGTPGSNGQSVLLKKSQFIKVTLELKNIVINKIVARCKPIHFAQVESLAAPTDIGLDNARIGAGRVILSSINDSDLDVSVSAEFQELQTPNKQPLQVNLEVPANSNSNRVINLSGCFADLILPAPGLPQYFTVRILGATHDTGDSYATLENQDNIQVEMRLENLFFDHITGRIQERPFTLSESISRIKIPNGFENLTFSRGKLLLKIFNTLDMPIRFQGQVIGQNSSSMTRSMALDIASLKKNAVTEIGYDEKNSQILELLNLPPTRLSTSGIAYVGDGKTVGTLSSDDYVYATFNFETPAILSWSDSDLKLDTTVIHISPENDSQKYDSELTIKGSLTRRLEKCTLDFNWKHSLPVTMQVIFKLGSNMTRLINHPELVIGPFRLPAPELDNDGKVKNSIENALTINLTDPELELFKNNTDSIKSVYILTQAFFQKTNKPVQFYASDALILRGLAKLTVRIDEDN